MLAEEIGQRPHIFGVAVQAQVRAAFQQHQPFGFASQRVQDLRMFRGNDLVGRAVQEQDGDGRDLGDIALGGVGIAQQQRTGEGDFVVADFGIGSEGGFDGDGAQGRTARTPPCQSRPCCVPSRCRNGRRKNRRGC